jgi:hypothetical protein
VRSAAATVELRGVTFPAINISNFASQIGMAFSSMAANTG